MLADDPTGTPVLLEASILRKSPGLPRYVEVPPGTVERLGFTRTGPVEVALNGTDIGRRNLKPWGGGRDVWFFDLTAPQCDLARVETGDHVEIRLRAASDELPSELSDLLERSATARRAWEELSESRRRMLADQVRDAKQAETRVRRAEKALLG